MKRTLFLSGNEAIAAGAARARVGLACAYPGTPSTEIIESIAAAGELAAEWCINEKVAMETAIGACLAGARALVAMKHVGLNVAADPFMTLSLIGVNAGLVVVCADDPGMHSSQNEQDTRHYARFAKVPLLEPSDSQEAYEYVARAFELSEEFDTPVLLRTTTRLSHGRGRVVRKPAVDWSPGEYRRDIPKYVMVPQFARERNRVVLQRLSKLRAYAEHTDLTTLEAGTADFGIIASGMAYQYAREAFPKAWILKLGMTWPLPIDKIAQLYRAVPRVAVVEELDPFLEDQIRALGLPVIGKQALPSNGEFNQEIVFAALEPHIAGRAPSGRRHPVPPAEPVIAPAPKPEAGLPQRPPVLCPGCPHRSVFAALGRSKVTAFGDIGCYTLGALPPLNGLDSCVCMGASIGMMAGMNKALGRKAAAAVLGDSTFFHSGITPLIDARYNETEGLVLILDNRTTAMTGHQGHPGSGIHADRTQGPQIDIQQLCDGLGIRCTTLDALDGAGMRAAVEHELGTGGLGVLVARAPCALTLKSTGRRVVVDVERCNLCSLCLALGCPALAPGDESTVINDSCVGCGTCVDACRRGALSLPAFPEDEA